MTKLKFTEDEAMVNEAEFLVTDKTLNRHWCPISQEYAGGDALLTALNRGWQFAGLVFRQDIWLGGARRISVFHIDLTLDSQTVRMRVITNPFVERFLSEKGIRIVVMNHRKSTALERW